MERYVTKILPADRVNGAFEGRLPDVVVVGVDLYRTKKCAEEDNANIDLSRPWDEGRPNAYFSHRQFQILRPADLDDDDTLSSLEEVRDRLLEVEALRNYYLPTGCRPHLHLDGPDAIYVFTDLTGVEVEMLDALVEEIIPTQKELPF